MGFKSVPATIVPFSTKTEEEAIAWAKDWANENQLKTPEDFISANFFNLKTFELGQVLSDKYSALVRQVFAPSDDEEAQVFVRRIVTEAMLTSRLSEHPTKDELDKAIVDALNGFAPESVASKKDIADLSARLDAVEAKLGQMPEPTIEQEALTKAVMAAPDVLEDTKTAAAEALSQRVSLDDVVQIIGGQAGDILKEELNIQQIYNEAVAGAIAHVTSEGNMQSINAAAERQVLGRIYAGVVRAVYASNERLITALESSGEQVTLSIGEE
jgi:hypothetical protein